MKSKKFIFIAVLLAAIFASGQIIHYRNAPAYINVKDYGAKGDDSTDDAAAINAAATAARAINAILYFPGLTGTGSYRIGSQVDFTDLAVKMDAWINVNFNGTGVIWENTTSSGSALSKKRIELRLKRPSVGWTAGNIGATITNPKNMTFELEASNFWRGFVIQGNGATSLDCVYNHFFLGYIGNNQIGIQLRSLDTAGYSSSCNENIFYGGNFGSAAGSGTAIAAMKIGGFYTLSDGGEGETATSIEVLSTANMIAGDNILVTLSDNDIHRTTVASVTDADTVVITAGIPAGHTVKTSGVVQNCANWIDHNVFIKPSFELETGINGVIFAQANGCRIIDARVEGVSGDFCQFAYENTYNVFELYYYAVGSSTWTDNSGNSKNLVNMSWMMRQTRAISTGAITLTWEHMNSVIYMTETGTATLPHSSTIPLGSWVTVYSTTAVAISVDVKATPADTDVIVLNGVALTAGHKVTSASGAGDFITLQYGSSGKWYMVGRSGTWTDGG